MLDCLRLTAPTAVVTVTRHFNLTLPCSLRGVGVVSVPERCVEVVDVGPGRKKAAAINIRPVPSRHAHPRDVVASRELVEVDLVVEGAFASESMKILHLSWTLLMENRSNFRNFRLGTTAMPETLTRAGGASLGEEHHV